MKSLIFMKESPSPHDKYAAKARKNLKMHAKCCDDAMNEDNEEERLIAEF